MQDLVPAESILGLPTAPTSFTLGLLALLFVVGLALLGSAHRRRRSISKAREAAHAVAGYGVVVVGASGRVLDANGTARELLWRDEPRAKALTLPEPIKLLLSDGAEQHHVLRVGRGQLLDLLISAPVKDGSARGVVVRDVTEDRRGRDHLLRLAHYDSLTGLGNRRLFIDRLKVATQNARESGGAIGLLYIDVDRFKEVNDSLGHGAGDELLKTVADRFRSEVETWRERSGHGESFVARLSGDEFAIVVMGFTGLAELQQLAKTVLLSMAQPIPFDGRTIPCSGSMGVAILPDHGLDVEDLVKAADAALYVAKEKGRGRFEVYEHAFTTQADYSRKLEKGLRVAIANGEFRLYYQPKVDVASDTVSGFEALLRWYNDELGFVSPKDFIPVAEERGLICEIGAWCIDEACRQIRVWRESGFETVPVSVNVSSIQFAESDLQQVITNALVRHGVEPRSFEIELTESLILADNETTALTLRDLRAIGVRVALDDFGTGYSALTYLNRFPLDIVKMDRGFLRGIENDTAAAGIASAVISMSHSLGFEVVAEGVDCERQSQLLRSMGCDQIQGFLYSPALPAIEVARYLAPQGGNRPPIRSSAASSTVDRILAAGDGVEASRPRAASQDEVRARAERARKRSLETRTLVIDDERSSFGQVALRMMRLGADVHLVQEIDEASVFVEQDEPALDLVVIAPSIDLRRLAVLREQLLKKSAAKSLRILVIGEPVDSELRQNLREARVDWLVTERVEDVDLRFFIAAARSQADRPQEQRAVRVPVETTAWIRANGGRRIGTLTSLSRRGAFIETADPYEIGQSIRLEFKVGTTHVRAFGNVSYRNEGGQENSPYRPSGVGVAFYESDGGVTDEIDGIIEQIWARHRP